MTSVQVNRHRTAVRGERAAVWYLRWRGWRIVARNFRVGSDELDVIALSRDGRMLVVVEVKASAGRWPAMDRIDPGKVHRLRRASDALPRQWTCGRRVRIDIALVRVGRVFGRVRYSPAAC